MPLQSRMTRFIQGWQNDPSFPWVSWLGNLHPDPSCISPNVSMSSGSPVIPGRKNSLHSQAPSHSHLFRAFDVIFPADVRVVFLGQDPYPCVKRATGRAFEQGDLNQWTQSRPSATASMRRIAQEVAAIQGGNQSYRRQRGGWPRLKKDIAQLQLTLTTPMSLFNYWQRQGVLFLNAALTYTQPDHLNEHMRMWAPFVNGICWKLACRRDPIVFVVLGCRSLKALLSSHVISHRLQTSRQTQNTRVLFRFHPATLGFFAANAPNMLDEVNQPLSAVGGGRVNWRSMRRSSSCPTDPWARCAMRFGLPC